MKHYRVALYLRLSKEDEAEKELDDLKEESSSILNQRFLLNKYVEEHFTDYTIKEYVDDGYTGLNFVRPGIQQLLDQAKNSNIDCMIVKDFSRFSRDYLELGIYLEKIFPSLGVRFISINDHYDSICPRKDTDGFALDFQKLLYDLYSKDLSQKVRTSLIARKEQGIYISANSPFGYEKAANDRHKLLIAQDEAKLVRRIFNLAEQGYSSIQIAKRFNEENIMTPIEFKIAKGKTTRQPKGDRFLWNPSFIRQVLQNRIYIGDMVYGKYEKDLAEGKTHIKPCSSWKIIKNCHEPIITRELFEQVQKKRNPTKLHRKQQKHPLSGKLVCGCCGRNLRYRSGRNPYFYCYQMYSNAKKYCIEKINAMYIEQYLLFILQQKKQNTETDNTYVNHTKILKEWAEQYIQQIIVHKENKIEIIWKQQQQGTVI